MSGSVEFLLAFAGLALGAGLGWLLSSRFYSRRFHAQELALERAAGEARTDPLTGLANRKAFDEHLGLLTAIARRYGGTVSLIMFDVDELKRINDRDGHAAGDAALRQFAEVLRGASRESDFPAHLGGDEFAVLLPHTAAAGAVVLADRVRQFLHTCPCPCPPGVADSLAAGPSDPPPEGGLQFRVSAGIAEWHPDDTPAKFLERTDQALYRAKKSGGDRVATQRSKDSSTR